MRSWTVAGLIAGAAIVSLSSLSFAVTEDENGNTCTDIRGFPPAGFPGCRWPIRIGSHDVLLLSKVGRVSQSRLAAAYKTKSFSELALSSDPYAPTADEGARIAQTMQALVPRALEHGGRGLASDPSPPPPNGGGLVTMGSVRIIDLGDFTIIGILDDNGGGVLIIIGDDGHGYWLSADGEGRWTGGGTF